MIPVLDVSWPNPARVRLLVPHWQKPSKFIASQANTTHLAYEHHARHCSSASSIDFHPIYAWGHVGPLLIAAVPGNQRPLRSSRSVHLPDSSAGHIDNRYLHGEGR